MFSQWVDRIKLAKKSLDASSENNDLKDDVARVSAALLVEIARADHQLDPSEISAITHALQKTSTLEDSEVHDIVSAAVVEVDSAISLHQHIKLVNEHFDSGQKHLLIEQMWRVAVADGRVDDYETYTIRKVSDLLHVPHKEFIQAKLRVIDI